MSTWQPTEQEQQYLRLIAVLRDYKISLPYEHIILLRNNVDKLAVMDYQRLQLLKAIADRLLLLNRPQEAFELLASMESGEQPKFWYILHQMQDAQKVWTVDEVLQMRSKIDDYIVGEYDEYDKVEFLEAVVNRLIKLQQLPEALQTARSIAIKEGSLERARSLTSVARAFIELRQAQTASDILREAENVATQYDIDEGYDSSWQWAELLGRIGRAFIKNNEAVYGLRILDKAVEVSKVCEEDYADPDCSSVLADIAVHIAIGGEVDKALHIAQNIRVESKRERAIHLVQTIRDEGIDAHRALRDI